MTGGGNLREVKALSLFTVKRRSFRIDTKNIIDYYAECGTACHVQVWLLTAVFFAVFIYKGLCVNDPPTAINRPIVGSLITTGSSSYLVRLDFRTGSEYGNCNQ